MAAEPTGATAPKHAPIGHESIPRIRNPRGGAEPQAATAGGSLTERRSWRRVRLSLVREATDRPYALRDAGDVVGLLRAFLRDDPRERFAVVYLDTRHRPIAVHDACTGTADSTQVHPREVFGPALQLAATALIVAHNHPSGDPTPSAEDHRITARLREAGELLGVPLLDHLVVGECRYFSFASEGTHALPEVRS